MRKILILLLAVLVFSVTGLVACSKTDESSDNSQSIQSGIQSISGGAQSSSGGSQSSADPIPEELPKKLTVLYQGDSITDMNRSRTDLTDFGNGYARMVSESLAAAYGDDVEFSFLNRANSGWKLIANWNGTSNYEDEFYQYDADIVTILIGYNDIMASTWDSANAYVSDEEYEEAYERLLKGLKDRGTYAICLAPYYIFDYLSDYAAREFAAKRAIVRDLAEKYGFGYIDMKPYMEAALEDGAERMELFGDGTHPIHAGNRIIASLVDDAIRKRIDKDYISDGNVGKYEPIAAVSDNDEDLTNSRLYVYSSLGDVEYDTETYCNDGAVSTQSVKLTNRGIEGVGAYTQASFVFGDDNLPDMTNGSLQFDVKVENAMIWLSVKAYASFWTIYDNVSSEYGVDLADTSVCSDLGDGWYRVTIDLGAWNAASVDNAAILIHVKQLVITMSRGETSAARESAGIDLGKESAMWIDNLSVSDNSSVIEISNDYIYEPASFSVENFKGSLKAFTFEYKAIEKETNVGSEISFTIWTADWGKRITDLVYVDVVNNTVRGAEGICEDIGDGWYKVTINCKDFPINIAEGATGEETAGLLYFNTVDHAFLFNRAKFVNGDLAERTVIVIGGEGGGKYKETQKATITATIPEGKVFVEWQIGGVSVSTRSTYTFVVNGDVIVTAVFADEHNAHNVTVIGGEGGGRFNEGMQATVVATVPEGKIFVEWQVSGVKVSDKETYTFEVTEDITLTAIFKDDDHPDAKQYVSSLSWFNLDESLDDFASSDKWLVFEYKAVDKDTNTGNGFQFTLWVANWGLPRCTELITVDVVNNTVSGVEANVKELGDGWHRVAIRASALPVNVLEGATGSESVGSFILNVVDHAVLLDNVGFYDLDLTQYTVTVVDGTGSGVYDEGATVTVIATVPDGHYFVEWQINGEKVSERRSYKFTVDNDVTISAVFAEGEEPETLEELPKKLTVLYQGDSITDMNRSRTDLTDFGNGYARMVSESLAAAYGDDVEFSFLNRANSGWKLIANWNGTSNYEDEFYQYDADIVTILIGYNDIMASTWDSANAYVSDEEYEEAYERLLKGLKDRGTYAICLAPYYIFDYLSDYAAREFAAKRAIVRDLAEKYGFGYIDMKPYMEAALEDGAERMELFGDGTHPIHAGNRIIASLVDDAIRKRIDKDYISDGNVGKYEPIAAVSDNDEDLTNSRLYVYSSLGDVEYDTETYCNDGAVSTQSVKLTNRGIEGVGAYTQASFVFGDDNLPDMTNGSLQFDVKVENAMIWLSVKAYASFWTIYDNVSSEYGVDLADTSVCSDLGDGWYRVTIDLGAWNAASVDNAAILIHVKQLVITMSRGETSAARESAGIDLGKESAMWIDNLTVNS